MAGSNIPGDEMMYKNYVHSGLQKFLAIEGGVTDIVNYLLQYFFMKKGLFWVYMFQ